MAPEVLFTVLYNSAKPPEDFQNLHTFTPAILDGHCRRRVQYADYPGVIPDRISSVRGVFVTGLTDANREKLDTFEGSEYTREKVTIRLVSQDDKKEFPVTDEEQVTETYIFKHRENLEPSEWDFEHFKKEKLKLWTRDWSV